MVSAFIYTLLQPWLHRVPSKNLGEMWLFSITDLPLIIVHRAIWLKVLLQLRTYQLHLTFDTWASISSIYPRNVMLVYAFYLFEWGNYCNRLEEIMTKPDLSILAEIFIRYNCQIDLFVDNFDSKSIWQGEIRCIKYAPGVEEVLVGFLRHLGAIKIPPTAKRNIIKLFANYRRGALNAMKHWASSTQETISETLKDKSATAGDLFATWSDILASLYDVPEATKTKAHDAFFNFCMMVQIIDDLGDTPVDHVHNTQNIFVEIVKQTPQEWKNLEDHLRNHKKPFISWPWVRANIPQSYQKMFSLYDDYANKLLQDDFNSTAARKLFDTVDTFRRFMG